MTPIAQNLLEVRARIEAACRRAGRDVAELTLIAVTKTQPVAVIEEAIAHGVGHIGENRIQEAREKLPELDAPVTRHLIGTLQSNKARFVPELFDWVHSIDRLSVAQELGRRARAQDREINVLLQINVSGETTKHGASPDEATDLATQVGQIEGLRVRGLMTMAPFTDEVAIIRRSFRKLKMLFDELQVADIPGVTMEHLSMGMSHDFEVAIEEGATMLRIGSAIFGPRR